MIFHSFLCPLKLPSQPVRGPGRPTEALLAYAFVALTPDGGGLGLMTPLFHPQTLYLLELLLSVLLSPNFKRYVCFLFSVVHKLWRLLPLSSLLCLPGRRCTFKSTLDCLLVILL